MIPALRKVAQLNIKYRKKWGLHNRSLNRDPTGQSYGPSFNHYAIASVMHFGNAGNSIR